MRSRLRPLLAWVLFHRFHLLVAAGLVGFPWLATGPARLLLANLYAVGFWDLVAVSGLALAVARVLVLTANLASRHGPARLAPGGPGGCEGDQEPPPLTWDPLGPSAARLRSARVPIAVALALPTIATAFAASAEPPPGTTPGAWLADRVLAVLLGAAALAAALVAASLLTALLSPPEATASGTTLVDLSRWPLFRGWLARMAERGPPSWARRLRRWLTGVSSRGPLGPGYVCRNRKGELELLPGHLVASSLFAVTFFAYLLLGIANHPGLGPPWMPTLGSLLLLHLLAAWGLPGVSFCLDRFRIPVLALLVVFSIVAVSLSGHDASFELRRPLAPLPARASDDEALFERLTADAERPLVVVAAAGGGITSSAWTAEALTRLAEDRGTGAAFLASLRLLSGVSGGSVGSMFFVDRFPDRVDRPLEPEAGRMIRAAAGASSLDAVGWGLAYPDLWRALAPPLAALFVGPEVDRSWALERSWQARLADPGHPVTLGAWRTDTLSGRRPLVVFNSTVVETGERFQLPTLMLEPASGRRVFWRTFAGHDVAVVSAARLSATFPFVSQAARARDAGGEVPPDAHFVDGGYYDNSGLLSALEILDATLERAARERPAWRVPVVLVLLRPFAVDERPLAEPRGAASALTAVTGPLQALSKVRTATQVYRNGWEMALFEQKWEQRGYEIGLVDLPLGGQGPLSWKLTDAERRTIAEAWRHLERTSPTLADLRRCLEHPHAGVFLPTEGFDAETPGALEQMAAE